MTSLLSLRVVLVVSTVALALLCVDVFLRARDAWRRRRRAQGGVYGVVVDRDGRVLGTYVDPTQPPRRASFVHGPGSVWTGSDPTDSTAWAWEGQGATEEDARRAAYRLRQLYVNLLPELRESLRPGDEEVEIPPWT